MTYDDWKCTESRLDAADDPRCPDCGNDPCLCEDEGPRCEACQEPCGIRWRRLAEGTGRTGWEFVSKCCEATVVDGAGRELTIEEAEACG